MTTELVKNVILEIEKLKKNKDIDNKDFKKLMKQIIQKVQPRKLTDWNIFVKQKIPEIKKMYPQKKHSELFAIIAIEWNELKVSKTPEIDIQDIDVNDIDEIDIDEIDIDEIDVNDIDEIDVNDIDVFF
tara:strand:- start:932 stop:1318 length:387 start_codon:yes stop_codon:yes gene_type:complete